MKAEIETWNQIKKVETYSGYRFDERPTLFHIGERKISVTDILDRWYGPDYSYFKVMGDDKKIYILRMHEYLHMWELKGSIE